MFVVQVVGVGMEAVADFHTVLCILGNPLGSLLHNHPGTRLDIRLGTTAVATAVFVVIVAASAFAIVEPALLAQQACWIPRHPLALIPVRISHCDSNNQVGVYHSS